MKYCAVICEYNPLHNGHRYQLSEIRKRTECDGIICIMSGDFVQRAEPAIINKLARTECALLSGADMVIQLPTLYSTGNGELFAKGAIDIITKLPNVKYLAMGCETNQTDILETLANIQLNETTSLKNTLNNNLKNGLSYAESYADATAKTAEKFDIAYEMSHIILSKPNNVLCIEYIKALKRLNSGIIPLIIPRNNDVSISSSEIRKQFFDTDIIEIKRYIPNCTAKALTEEQQCHPINNRTYSDIMMYALKNTPSSKIKTAVDASEGIQHRIASVSQFETDYYKLLSAVKTKRYTLSRIKRICLHSILDINRYIISDITHTFAQVLGIKSEFLPYLGTLPPFITAKAPNIEQLPQDIQKMLNIEKTAHKLYALFTHNTEYKLYNRLITI